MIRFFALALAVLFALVARPASACGGFLAPRIPPGQTSIPDLRSDGSQVAIVRDGLRTVVSLRMRYRGPPEDFALVVPVPVVLGKDQVRTVRADVFQRLDMLTRPKIVEQWEDYPCLEEQVAQQNADAKEGGTGTRAKGEEGSMGGPRVAPVRIEAQYSVGEYDIVILGATDSLALEAWLKDAGYAMPPNIEPFLRPYVTAGSKFFVAKVDASKIDLSWGRAILSPIRFHYDSESFSLPIRLGLANVDSDQDLTVWVISPGTRYEIANYDNSVIPTNLRLVEGARFRFEAFYEDLFRDTLAKHPRSIVTEYAGSDSCSECGLPPDAGMVLELGGDVLPKKENPQFVVSRLHARYGPSFDRDFVFRAAPPLEGGHEPIGSADLPTAAGHPGSANHFQARYFIRHPWRDGIDCSNPTFGLWRGANMGSPDARRVALPAKATLDDFMFRGPDVHTEATLYDRLQYLHVYDFAFALPAAIVLLFSIVALVVLARRVSVPVWKPIVLAVVVSAAPALSAIVRVVWRSVQSTPLPTLQFILYVVATVLVVALWTMRASGRVLPRGLHAAVALLPLLVSLVAFRLLIPRLDFWSVDDEQALRIFAEGEGEACEGIVLGACASTLLLGVVAWSVVFSPSETSASRSLGRAGWIASIVLGVATNLFAQIHAAHDARWVPYVAAPAFLFGLFLTWRAEKRMLDGERMLALGMTWLLAMTCIAIATITSVRAWGLQAMSGESVDPSQRVRILTEMFGHVSGLSWRLTIATLASVAAPLLLAYRNHPPRVLGRGMLPALGVLATCAFLWWSSHRMLGTFYAQHALPRDDRAIVSGLEPIEAYGYDFPVDRTLEGPALYANAKGELLASPNTETLPRPFDDALFTRMASDTLHDPSDPLLVADRALTIARLDAALDPMMKRRHATFRFVIGQRRPHAVGVYGALFEGPDTRGALPFEWRRKLAIDPAREKDPRDALAPGALAIRMDGAPITLPLLGAHGKYRRLPNAKTKRMEPSSYSVDYGISRSSLDYGDLGRYRVTEYLLVVKPDTTTKDLAVLAMSLEDVPPRPSWEMTRDPYWETNHPKVHFVVTTDGSPFE